MDENDLIEIDIGNDVEAEESLPIIRLELDGILSEEELIYVKNLTVPNDDGLMPLFIIHGTEKILCGYLELNLDFILNLRFIGMGNYFLYLFCDKEVTTILSPNQSEIESSRLLNFIKVR